MNTIHSNFTLHCVNVTKIELQLMYLGIGVFDEEISSKLFYDTTPQSELKCNLRKKIEDPEKLTWTYFFVNGTSKKLPPSLSPDPSTSVK